MRQAGHGYRCGLLPSPAVRILYHHRVASKDGQFVHVEELTDALRRRGHEIFMVGPASVRDARFGEDTGWVSNLKRWLPGAVYELAELAYGMAGYARLRRAAGAFAPDGLYERYNLYLPCGVWLKRRARIPMLLEVNAPLWEERSRYGGIALSGLARATERHAWNGADRVLPVTEVLAEHVRRAGVSGDRVVVIPNGVDPRRFEGVPPRTEAKAALGLAGSFVLGFTGFVREWHGLERALSFMADRGTPSDVRLLVVGDGPDRPRLEEIARRLGVERRMRFTGAVERADIPRHVAAFDVALQPAVVDYASPLKLFEYLALGHAIVAPSTPNIREILTDGEHAVLFDADDPGAFERAVATVCADGDLRARIGRGARRLIADRGLTWDDNAARVEQLFRNLGAGAA